jgi:hypothetical protein
LFRPETGGSLRLPECGECGQRQEKQEVFHGAKVSTIRRFSFPP